MSIRVAALAGLVAAVLAVAACGGDDNDVAPTVSRMQSSTVLVPATPGVATVPEQPTEFKVAFVNVLSPVALDSGDTEAGTTFDERLEILIAELNELQPDLVAFTEVSWTKAHGGAAERLQKGLRMEFTYARANPWYPGQTKEQSDQVAKLAGFDEGELVLSRYPILRSERRAVNPRTSETEGRVVLHVVVKGPAPIGELDVYVTHLTGGSDKTRQAQAADVMAYVWNTRGEGAALVMGDLSDPVESPTYEAIAGRGFPEVVPRLGQQPAMTCCRESVLGQQPPETERHDFIFAAEWQATSATIFGSVPRERADGTLLYASDHNGVFAVFPLTASPP
ncbi:MAG: hypothetical protein HY875_13555 [Chloroflexi bacterium]|nr:hypothetical protein [Chloroflexota bacterium]